MSMFPFRLLVLWPPLLMVAVSGAAPDRPPISTRVIMDSAVEMSLNLTDKEEGSGIEGSGSTPVMQQQLDDESNLTASAPLPTPQATTDQLRFRDYTIKRAAADPRNSKLGNVPIELLVAFTHGGNSQRIPTFAYRAMGRPLQKGLGRPQREEYVIMKGTTPRQWGKMYYDANGILQAEFIQNDNPNFRVLTLPTGSADKYNIDYGWVLARDVDPLEIIVQLDTRKYYQKITAGVLMDGNYEVLGEADVENRRFRYVENGQPHIVEGSAFDNKVYVLVKRSCSCSCSGGGGGGTSFFGKIKDFFG